VLVLDYLDITAGGEKRAGLYYYQANQFAFQKNGMQRNPWDSAVQFKDELIRKEFASESGFEAVYRFRIDERVPRALWVVIERPDLYTVTCNGRTLNPTQGSWWLDKCFGRLEISRAAKVGENEIVLKATPFTIYHEIEPIYVLGEFALEAADKGYVIGPEQPIRLGAWNEQGHPFYSAGVVYRQRFDISAPAGRYVVSLSKWHGSVAKVLANGRVAGYIGYAPWECDVSQFIQAGANQIEVMAIGTLKNTLGPHHGKPALGTAWPGMFQRGPAEGQPSGKAYHTIGYGLFEPFALKEVK
jgi:hypothetical protein